MALSTGTRVGSYEIVNAIGAGGMGEVYRARDTKLNRDVALKILPDAFAADPDRLARFRREAQVLASLNHPHIAAIYGFEDAPFASSGHAAVHALVLELVEGPTLADRVARGPIPLDEALPIAKQIAEALEAAHEQGIIHRDLKPANIKVRPDGAVKVLDFGLAKALDPASGSALQASGAVTNSPTLVSPALMTGVGVLLGTAAYMAPEQARGKVVDRRADVWAFGCVLYELLAGRRAFPGDDGAETLAAVMTREPAWDALAPAVPQAIQRLLRRCLEKDPKRRLQAIGEARIILDDGDDGRSTSPPSANRIAHANRSRSILPWAAALMLAVALVVMWMSGRSGPAGGGRVTRFSIDTPEEAFSARRFLALSPDGRTLVYSGAANGPLYMRHTDQLESKPIAGTAGGTNPFFSPDGSWLAYNADNKLKKVSTTGGAPIVICDAPAVGGATWLSDDTIIFASFGGGATTQAASRLWRVSATGGTPLEIAKPDGQKDFAFRFPEALPDGRTILFAVHRTNANADGAAIAALRIDTGERSVLIEGGTSPHYVPGYLTYARAGGIVMAVPFDLRTLKTAGPAVQVLDRVVTDNTNGTTALAVSPVGDVTYLSGGFSPNNYRVVWVDRKGNKTDTGLPPDRRYERPQLSPDGQTLAMTIQRDGGGRDIWLSDLARRNLSRFTSTTIEAEMPVWTPDGSRIAYAIGQDQRQFAWTPADSPGAEEILATTDRHIHVTSWTPDGRTLLGYVNAGADRGTIWALERTGETWKLREVLRGPGAMFDPTVSPDGHWVAYDANDTGRPEVYVQAFPGPGSKYKISTDGGEAPTWTRNGHELVFPTGSKMMAVPIAFEGDKLKAGTPAELFEGSLYRTANGNAEYYDVTRDGQRFVMVEATDEQKSGVLVVAQNWIAEVRSRVQSAK
jgi:serine/threonine-protein kinase